MIQGTVQDANGPIAYASVTATDASGNLFTTNSDDTGTYSLVVPTGTYTVEADYSNEQGTQSDVAVSAGSSSPVSVTLAPTGINGVVTLNSQPVSDAAIYGRLAHGREVVCHNRRK